ncbi:inter-alpha-trypsin inhibitor heavy chain H5-like isoform X2 [Neocloeon triangulifer]|uniref:inter-alpha-trypsin inhibitor heavy chain H5-like isoform X2 n=1 Tax=Neocloeon triangulifer TaxID=2078957 RepID=UPI00286F4A9E|nr:inter-alpha-trypsin inhibitor heavy chain H5-like isoform X2 [Neocloeon triangulifer]
MEDSALQIFSNKAAFLLLLVSSVVWPVTEAIRVRPAQRPLEPEQGPQCEVQSYTLRSDIHLRYSTSMLRIQVANPERSWRTLECALNVVIPEAAFLSGVLAEIGEKVIETKVVERKSENVMEYEDDEDETLEPFEIPRESKLVKIGLSLRAKEEAVLYISYEQLITRKLGIYEVVLNLHPGQIVPELRVDAFIHESRDLSVLRVLGLRSGKEIDPLEGQSEFPLAKIIRPSNREAHIIFSPSRKQQAQFANSKMWLSNSENGILGQLVVQFELVRQKDGEITIKDGFFAHHYAPTALSVLPKHVVFVLDLSSSMAGRRIAQLKLAMASILDELKNDDFFSIIQFNSFKSVWRPYSKEKKRPKGSRRPRQFGQSINYGYSNNRETPVTDSTRPKRPFQKQPDDLEGAGRVIPAKPHYIAKAKRYINRMKASGGTNIQKALLKAIEIAHSTDVPLALVVFLTDGDSTVGETKTSYILKLAREANRKEKCTPSHYQETADDPPCNVTVKHVPIYSLAFGEEANIYFLRRLSAENFGTARRIYDAEDAAIQLQEVYAELAAPVQADCIFQYPENMVDSEWVTQHKFAAAFLGSEIVVAGKLSADDAEKSGEQEARDESGDGDFWGEVKGAQATGEVSTVHLPDSEIEFYPNTKFNPNLSHMWAYLTVYQLLLGSAARDSRDEATQIALEFSFVTATTTLQPHFEGDHDDVLIAVATSILRIQLPASQEVGNIMGDENAGNTDVCSEGGEGEYWFPLQQAFIPCGERKVTHHVPASSQQQSSENFGRNQIHEPNNSVGDKEEVDDVDFEEDKSIEQKYSLVDLESLSWLKDVRYGPRYLVLPKGRGGENQLFSLGLNESNEAYSPCLSPLKEPSHCRHLHFCSISELKDDFYEFLRFFCSINHFAGVCCPDSLFASEENNMPPYDK